MEVKICGITRQEDLKSSEKFDPAFIGFINVKRSARYVDIQKIKELKHSMEDSNKAILILEPDDAADVIKKAEECDIKNVQLHSLSPGEILKIDEINVIRAIGIGAKLSVAKIEEIKQFSEVCDYLLFDSIISGKSGGTGNQIPVEIALKAAEVARMCNSGIKLFLAGGMNIKRIKKDGKIISEIFDYVDVNSGVEDAPGIKNDLKIKEFMEICMVIE